MSSGRAERSIAGNVGYTDRPGKLWTNILLIIIFDPKCQGVYGYANEAGHMFNMMHTNLFRC